MFGYWYAISFFIFWKTKISVGWKKRQPNKNNQTDREIEQQDRGLFLLNNLSRMICDNYFVSLQSQENQ